MKTTLLAVLGLLAIACMFVHPDRLLAKDDSQASSPAMQAPAQGPVSSSFDDALKKAAAEHKRVLLDFSGSDWCHWCQVMEREVLSTPEFKNYADRHLVVVLVDFPAQTRLPESQQAQNNSLKNRYHIEGFPTFIVVSPEGRELDRVVGYMPGGPQAFLSRLQKTESAENPPAQK